MSLIIINFFFTAQYSASCLALSTIFVIFTVFVNLLRECNGTAPIALVRLAYFTMDRYLCIFTFSHVYNEEIHIFTNSTQNRNPESTIISPSPDELKRRKDWYAVSVMVDRIAFLCFAFIFLVLLSVLASVWWLSLFVYIFIKLVYFNIHCYSFKIFIMWYAIRNYSCFYGIMKESKNGCNVGMAGNLIYTYIVLFFFSKILSQKSRVHTEVKNLVSLPRHYKFSRTHWNPNMKPIIIKDSHN